MSRITFRDGNGEELEVEAEVSGMALVAPAEDSALLTRLRNLLATRREEHPVVLIDCNDGTKPPAIEFYDEPPDPSPYMIRNFYGQDGMAAIIKKRQDTEARRQRGECRYTYPEPKRQRKQR